MSSKNHIHTTVSNRLEVANVVSDFAEKATSLTFYDKFNDPSFVVVAEERGNSVVVETTDGSVFEFIVKKLR